MKEISHRHILSPFFGSIIFLGVIFSCSKIAKDQSINAESCLRYNEKFRVLYLQNCEILNVPDSIASKDIRHLGIESSEPIDFEVLSRHIDLKRITTIRINELNQPVVNLDLAFFSGLRSIHVGGTDKVIKINLLNIADSLTSVYLSAPNLTFPQFDSAFLALTYLRYEGKSDVVPQWIEKLNQLQKFSFKTLHISKIECDVCKMTEISEFSIVDLEVENKELYLKKMSVYPTIERIKTCKPELRFWTHIPPR